MKNLISVVILLACSAIVAEGQIESIPRFDARDMRLTAIDSLFVRGFGRGDTTQMNRQALRTLEQFIRNPGTNQQIFFRGTADRYRFPNVNDERNRQLNRNLASGRAQRALDDIQLPNLRVQVLEPWIDRPFRDRGVWVYKATYETAEAIAQRPLGPQFLPQGNRVDTVVLIDSILRIDSIFVYTDSSAVDTLFFGGASRWRFGVGGGVASLLTFGGTGMEFIVPTLSAFAQHDDKWYVTLSGGWRPMPEVTLGSPFPPSMNRAEAIAALTATLYPKRDVLGVAFGIRGAWETVRQEDEFLERAYGISVGPRLRFDTHFLVVGLDFQLSNESRFRGGDTSWRFGISPSMSVNHTFGRNINP